MIFKPFYKIINNNPEGVYTFLLKYFYENNCSLTTEENDYIRNTITNLSKSEVNSFDDFLAAFKDEKKLYKNLIKLRPNEKYDCFINNKRVYISALDGPTLSLTIAYLNIFGYANVEN